MSVPASKGKSLMPSDVLINIIWGSATGFVVLVVCLTICWLVGKPR